MGFLGDVVKGFTKFGAGKEEPVEPVQRIMIVKEAPRTKRQQFRDMINDNRDTDGVKKTHRKLREVCNGRAFDTNCEKCFEIPSSHHHHNVRGRAKSDFWRL